MAYKHDDSLKPFEKKIWLASPTMHGDELKYMQEAYETNWMGYNYRMSNVIAGVVRGQYPHLEEHIAQKKAIYERYKEGLKGLPIQMNPIEACSEPNYWLSCMIIDKEAMCKQVRGEKEALYISEKSKSCPTEILEAIASLRCISFVL